MGLADSRVTSDLILFNLIRSRFAERARSDKSNRLSSSVIVWGEEFPNPCNRFQSGDEEMKMSRDGPLPLGTVPPTRPRLLGGPGASHVQRHDTRGMNASTIRSQLPYVRFGRVVRRVRGSLNGQHEKMTGSIVLRLERLFLPVQAFPTQRAIEVGRISS
jgi:hypothetical protein